jgi:hypothetical protein
MTSEAGVMQLLSASCNRVQLQIQLLSEVTTATWVNTLHQEILNTKAVDMFRAAGINILWHCAKL